MNASKRPSCLKSGRMKPASPLNFTAWPWTPGTSWRSSGDSRRSNLAGLVLVSAASTPVFVKASSGKCTAGAGTATAATSDGDAGGTAAKACSAAVTAALRSVSLRRSSSDLNRRTNGGGTSPCMDSSPFSFRSPNMAAIEK